MFETLLTKVCRRCSVENPLLEFHKQPRGPLGRHSWCRTCANAYYRAGGHKKADPAVRRLRNFKRRYSMTGQDFDAMWARQGGLCAICETPLLRPKIDHDHQTGAVRGLLCHRCNLLLAGLEDAEFRRRAMAYLSSTAVFLVNRSPSQESV